MIGFKEFSGFIFTANKLKKTNGLIEPFSLFGLHNV